MPRRRKNSIFNYEGVVGQQPLEPRKEQQNDEGYWDATLKNPPPDINHIHTTVDVLSTKEEEKVNHKRGSKTALGKKVDAIAEKYRQNPTLVRNPIIGYRSKEIIEEAVRRGALVRTVRNGIETWAIPTEDISIGTDSKGNALREPKIIRQVSEAYYKFMEELNQGTLKITKSKGLF